jgi:hypothetical protein
MSVGNFTGRTGRGDGQFAQGGSRGDHDRHHRHDRGVGIATGLAAGSALGYGYGGYNNPNSSINSYNPNSSIDSYGYYDPNDEAYSGSVVSSTDASSCALHHKSYDPVYGTYLGRDGLRHHCPP